AGAVFAIGPSTFSKPGDYVARIRIQGLIRNNQDRVEALARLSRSHAKAVIVHIDSPGGTTAGSQQLYDSLRDLQAKKPMVVVAEGRAERFRADQPRGARRDRGDRPRQLRLVQGSGAVAPEHDRGAAFRRCR